MKMIDPESILSCYEGHTIFSIFFDRIVVYEQILAQLTDQVFEDAEDMHGTGVENSYLRRLYRVLNRPVNDLAFFKDIVQLSKAELEQRSKSLKGKNFVK